MKEFLTILLTLAVNLIFAQSYTPDIIYPTDTIKPFELTTNPVNFPLGHATPVGDINGDGQGDFVFNSYGADERTEEPTDRLSKSVITTDTGINASHIVFYDSKVFGIGDYDGDGFDDILDFRQQIIRFGCPDGISNDSLVIGFAEHYHDFLWAGDINNDGKSEFLIGDDYNNDTLLIFSGPDILPVEYIVEDWYSSFNDDHTYYYCYDYDNDGEDELCISSDSFFYDQRYMKWFYLDKDNNQFILEHTEFYDYIHEPSVHFPAAFCDINGDQIMDFAHVYFEYDSVPMYHLEVYLGLADAPYFEQPAEIEVGNPTRIFYNAGDFNGDGADDWYSKYNNDTIVVYYGNQNILTEGFQTAYYSTGFNQLLLPKSRSYNSFETAGRVSVTDFNNDMIKDLYFNYWAFDSDLQFDIIGTAVIIGGDTPDFTDPLVIGNSGNLSFGELEFGENSKKIGDINQDGFDDWGILAKTGCYLEVYYGGEVLDIVPDITYILPQTSKAICLDWSSGDLNGDGWIDIVISNSSHFYVYYPGSFITAKRDIYIYLGGPTLQSKYNYQDADFILQDTGTFREFGRNISIVGDYNADGFDDLVVGGSAQWGGSKKAFVYFGGNQVGPGPDLVITYNSSESFAQPITACGDINADGYDDFTLGEHSNGTGNSLIYYGGPNADAQYDESLHYSFNGLYFGRNTSRTEGDFDGDGYPDLIQYSHMAKEIFIYKGGPDFDKYYDYSIYDSAFSNYFHCIEFIDNTSETGASDIAISYKNGDNFDFYVYSGGSIQSQEANYLLKNNLYQAGICIASGDFNNDGYTEIFAGIPFERNYGSPGGVVNYYQPTLFVSEKENYPNTKPLSMSLYPNPTSSTLNVEFSLDMPGTVVFKLMDIVGNNILTEKQFFETNGQNKFQIEMRKYEGGVYILEIQQGSYVSQKKFVIY